MIRTWTAERQRAAVMWISLPFGAKRDAFSMMFVRTCPIWTGSASTGGRSGRIVVRTTTSFQGASHPLEHRADHLVDEDRLRRGNERARPHPSEIEEVADDQVQVIGFLDDRAQHIPPLLVAVVRALGEQTGRARLDGCERRPEVVGDGGEEGGSESVRFHLQPGLSDLAVEGRPLDRERRLRRERLQEADLR